MRRIGVTLAVVVLALMMPVQVLAQTQSPPPSPTYPPQPQPEIDVGPTDPNVGDKVTVTGRGWCPGSEVDIYLDVIDEAHYLGTATVQQDGTFSTKVTIPPGTAPGPHEILVSGLAYNCQETRVMSRTITVGGGDEAGGGSLPFTGANISLGLLILVALLAAGLAATAAGRRRSRPGEE